MIPKVIHYCWFGKNPLPKSARKCINSWKRFFPDYEIKEWNEDNFDISIIPYVKEAYEMRKFAFVSDYARFWILYNYGGIYFDTDVEVVKSLKEIVSRGAFMGAEKNGSITGLLPVVAPGLGIGCEAGISIFKVILDNYSNEHFINSDGSLNLKTVVNYTSAILAEFGMKATSDIQQVEGIWIYPQDYFCPYDYLTKEMKHTSNTVAIHWYDGSWISPSQKLYRWVKVHLGTKVAVVCSKLYHWVVK